MPMPTKMYKVVTGAPNFDADVTEVNEFASQGWTLEQMMQIGGGAAPGRFLYLMSRTVTAQAAKTAPKEKKSG
jgi:hypothetical protein